MTYKQFDFTGAFFRTVYLHLQQHCQRLLAFNFMRDAQDQQHFIVEALSQLLPLVFIDTLVHAFIQLRFARHLALHLLFDNQSRVQRSKQILNRQHLR